MSDNLIINKNTNTKPTKCLSYQNNNNEKIFNFNFTPTIYNKENNRKNYIDSSNIVGVMQNNNYDLNGLNIDDSTIIRNSSIQNNIGKKELETRLFAGPPLLFYGQTTLNNPDLTSRLNFGEDTRVFKSQDPLSAYSADTFIPLVPSIRDNIQNIDHIIPTYWVRGGMNTRSVIRNIDYLKSCGIK